MYSFLSRSFARACFNEEGNNFLLILKSSELTTFLHDLPVHVERAAIPSTSSGRGSWSEFIMGRVWAVRGGSWGLLEDVASRRRAAHRRRKAACRDPVWGQVWPSMLHCPLPCDSRVWLSFCQSQRLHTLSCSPDGLSCWRGASSQSTTPLHGLPSRLIDLVAGCYSGKLHKGSTLQ